MLHKLSRLHDYNQNTNQTKAFVTKTVRKAIDVVVSFVDYFKQ